MFTRIVNALEKTFERGQDGKDTFEEWLVWKAISEGGVYLQETLKRVSPIPKQTFNPVVIEFPENGTPAEKADAVLVAMANGQISPDVGHVFIDAISKSLGIEEVTELAKRLEALEKMIDAKKTNA